LTLGPSTKFIFGGAFRKVGILLVVLGFVLAGLASVESNQYYVILGFAQSLSGLVFFSGIVLWLIESIRAKPSASEKYLIAGFVVVSVLAFFLFENVAPYSRGLGNYFFFSVLFGAVAALLGTIGAFASMINQRIGGGFLLAGPGLALLFSVLSDPSHALVYGLWWSVPAVLGILFFAKKREMIPRKGAAAMGFASLVLPWFNGLSSTWTPIGSQESSFYYFLPGINIPDTSQSLLSSTLYLALIPFSLVLIGSTLYLTSSIVKGSDIGRRKRSVVSGILLIVAGALAGLFLFGLGVILWVFGGRYISTAAFPSAGCWLALITGTIMTAPLSFRLEETRETAETTVQPMADQTV